MGLPAQNIPQSEKTPEWIKTNIRAINAESGSTDWQGDRDRLSWAMYDGEQNPSSFDYLRKVKTKGEEFEYPAFVRFVPLIRPKLDRLRTEYTQREFDFTVFTVDQQSVEKKADQQVKGFMSQIRASIYDKFFNIQQASKQVSQALALEQQKEQQLMQQQQGGIQPGTQGMEMMNSQQMAQTQVFQEVLKEAGHLSQQDLKKLDAMHGREGREIHEMLAQSGMEYLIYAQKLETTFNDGWQNKLVTDKPVFHVDWDSPYEDPFCRTVDTRYFRYAQDNEVDFIEDSEWAQYDMYMSVASVIDRFRYELSSEDLEQLEQKRGMVGSYDDNWGAANGWGNSNGVYVPWSEPVNLIKTTYTCYKSPRAVHWKKTPHPHLPGEHFEHIIDESDVPAPANRKKKDTYDTFYLDDIYEGYEIDEGIFVRLRRKPAQLRGIDKYGKVQLPFIGPAFRSKNRKTYSLVWRAKDIQILWNIMHFHKELWVALAGVKGFVMDKSQKPDDMSMAEWIYQKKMGVGWIQSDKKGRQFSFNQFKTYDDSLSPGIQYLMHIIEHLDDLAGKVTGITPNRMGQISKDDQVGTVNESIRQSAMTTEIVFWEYDQVRIRAMERLINLCRMAWKKGKRGAYILGNMQQKLLNIPANVFSDSEYRLFVKNSFKDAKKIQELRQIALQERNKNALTANGLVQVFTKDSLNDIEHAFNQYIEKSIQIQEQQQQQQHQNAMQLSEKQKQDQMQADQAKAKLEAEIQQQAQQFNNMMSERAAQLDEAKFTWEREKGMLEQELSRATLEQSAQATHTDAQVKIADTESERITEFAYLDEQKRATDIDTMVKLIQLRMQNDDSKRQERVKMKDVEAKIKVGNTKEKIKDRSPTK